MTWTREEVTELKRLRLDPIRNTPAKLRLLVAHFLKPEASVFAVTEGEGPVRVSKALALNGDLDCWQPAKVGHSRKGEIR